MMSWVAIAFGLLAFLSFALSVWQFVVATRFPLHQRVPDDRFAPSVTILKPLKGCDAETGRCLRSWLAQDYRGQAQILFGVASADDPVCLVVQELIGKFPNCDARLVHCPAGLGANSKASTLAQLEPHIKHEFILVSDADVRVPPDFLTNVVFPLRDPGVGLVNCFYRLANPSTLAMRWEAVAINADFWSQVLQARSLKPLNFALGAVMVTRRAHLAEIGGFVTLIEYLADDYQLGWKISSRGQRIELCPVVVECWEPLMDWPDVLIRQLRWARTIRFCQPMPYLISIISNATLWPFLWLFIHPAKGTLAVVSLLLLWRVFSAQTLEKRFTGERTNFGDASLVLVKDLLGAVIWMSAFIGREIAWRGEIYRVETGGKLTRVNPSLARSHSGPPM
jgi:ceramide glucosyltransferase